MSTPSHPAVLELPAGTHALCNCGATGNSPFCDGSHTRLKAAAATRRPWWRFWG